MPISYVSQLSLYVEGITIRACWFCSEAISGPGTCPAPISMNFVGKKVGPKRDKNISIKLAN